VTDLARLLDDAARGRFPAADGSIDIVPAPLRAGAAVFSFSAHLVVAADVDPAEVAAVATPGDFVSWGRVAPWLAARAGAERGTGGDVLLAAIASGEATRHANVIEADDVAHSRVERASRYRDDVRVFVTDDGDGVLTIGRGVADRYEVAFEVEPHARTAGLGRALVATALTLVPAGEVVWAQVHPANAASLRTVLAVGFQPIGFEQLVDVGG
jgi:L-amino acid N-acyltransferase YncA